MISESLPNFKSLKRGDQDYPWRLEVVLGLAAPDEIQCAGNLDLLDEHAISFCGSRNVSEKGIAAATSCARMAVEKRFVVTSGNARGVDRATHRQALEASGSTILVLPEGFDNFRIAAELRDVWDWERCLVISQFDNRAIWRSHQAMARNSVIIALSCAMIVVEAGEKGGTRAAGMEALRLKTPLFAIDYGFDESVAPGNRELIKKGAAPLKRSRDTGEPNLEWLIRAANGHCESMEKKLTFKSPEQKSFGEF